MARVKYLFKTPFYGVDIGSLDALKELSDAELDEIIEDFSSGATVAVMKEKYPYFNNRAFDSQLPYILSDKSCEQCKGLIYYKLERRQGRIAHAINEACADCGHTGDTNCSCETCVNEAKDLWDKFLARNFSSPKDIDQINTYDEALLYFLTEFHDTSDAKHIKFYSTSRYSYANTKDYRFPKEISNLIYNFIDRQLLIPSKTKNLHLIEKLEHDTTRVRVDYKTTRTYWDINLSLNGEKLSIAEFKELQKDKILTDAEKAMLWREVYLDEVSQYTAQISSMYLKQDLDAIYYDYITDAMIGDYSLSQAFAQIYYAVIATMKYKTLYNPSEAHINSNFRNNIMRNISNYDAKTSSNFNRPNYINSSIYNEFIIKNILEIKGDYFHSHTKEIIPSFESNIIEENIDHAL